MITLYNQNETDFGHNGLGVIHATSAVVTEELNGLYELSLTCPALPNDKVCGLISEFGVIRAPTPRGNQPFRVYKVNKTLGGEITVNARHVFYDGLYNLAEDVTGEDMTADAAIKLVYSNLANPNSFTVSSDIPDITASVSYQNVNPIAAVLGDGGLISIFGGGLLRDNFNVVLRSSIGEDRGFKVCYRKNLVGLDLDSNIENTATRVKPTCKNTDGDAVYLPEQFIDSPNISLYPWPLYMTVDYTDLTVGRDDVTEASAQAEMRSRVQALFSSGIDLPTVNAKVDFVLLRDTVSYGEFAPLEEIYLGDTVGITYDALGVDMTAKCIKYTYDALLRRYGKIELGSFREDFAVSTERAISGVSQSTSVVSLDTAELLRRVNTLETLMATHKHTGTDGSAKIEQGGLD